MSVVAGVDSSTQSTKVELRDGQTGALLGAGAAPHPQAHAPRSEQDPHRWWDALGLALDRATTAAGVGAREISAISVAAQCHGLVALDDHDDVIRPAKLWNDTESAPQLMRLRERIGEETWIRAVGSLPTAAFTMGKIAWLAEHEPQNFDRMSRICLPHDWLTFRLTGEHVTDRSEASGTGYWSATQGRYLTEYLDFIASDRDWESMLPSVLGPDEAAGVVTGRAAEELGLRPGTIVGPGGGDQHIAALGLNVAPGDVVYTLGTSGVVLSTSPDPVFDPAGMVDGVADCADGYLPLVSTLNAARVTDWAAGILGVDHAELSKMALTADPRESPVLVAYLDGERKPDLPGATGLLSGITAGTTREQIARAAHDGVLLGLLRGEREMRRAGVCTSGRVLATGGGSRSRAYRQILADLTGREVMLADPKDANEATARGATVQAAAVLQGGSVVEQRESWAPAQEVGAVPRPGTGGLGEELLDRYMTAAALRPETANGGQRA